MKVLFAAAGLAVAAFTHARAADETVKVGVLHSLSGTMAISETSLRDVLLFTFDEINAKGGVIGKKIEPVVVDGASNWPLFAEKGQAVARAGQGRRNLRLLDFSQPEVVLPVFEEKKGLLFYPVQYEGEEMSPNIFYTAEAVNQQATPAVDYMIARGKRSLPAGERLRLSANDQSHSARISPEQRRAAGEYWGGFKKDESGKSFPPANTRRLDIPTISRLSLKLSSSQRAERHV
jgi:urea transport system substrate-binding protein